MAHGSSAVQERVHVIDLEWLFRLIMEPRHLWRRYLVNNLWFLWGLDHGVGHSLLLLYDVKVPNGQKSEEFKNLGHYPLNTSLSAFYLNQHVMYVQLFDFSSFSYKALK